MGLMSGTSADGVTAALTKIAGSGRGVKVKLIDFETLPFPSKTRAAIFELFTPRTSTVDKICRMNFALGEIFAEAAISVAKKSGFKIDGIDLIGSHGQTIHHIPPHKRNEARGASTLQIGEPAVIAQRTGVATVADFRKRDVAAGGQGAPLVAYMDYVLHTSERRDRVLVNVGGIANLTFLPADARPRDVVAFDTGPGNMVVDALVRHYTCGARTFDRDGEIALQGRVIPGLLRTLLRNPYFSKNPPKTTGRETFGEQYASRLVSTAKKERLRARDVIATATALTSESIAAACRTLISGGAVVDEVYVSGGGARNRAMLKALKDKLAPARVARYDELGMPSEAKEAVCFALLANEHVMGVPCNIPAATGAREQLVLGALTPAG